MMKGGQQGSPNSPLQCGLPLDRLQNLLKVVPGNCAPSLATYSITAAGRNWKMQIASSTLAALPQLKLDDLRSAYR